MEFPDASIYQGNWTNGVMNGKGKMSYPDGRVFDGVFDMGQPCIADEGVKVFQEAVADDGSCYTGEWKGGLFHGWVCERGSVGGWVDGCARMAG